MRRTQARGRGGGEGVRTRDHLANVRTFLAWLRTGMVLLALGFVLARLPLVGIMRGRAGDQWAHWSGVATAAIGLGLVILAAARFWRARAAIEGSSLRPRVAANVVLSVLAGVGGLVVVAALIRG